MLFPRQEKKMFRIIKNDVPCALNSMSINSLLMTKVA